MQGPLATITLVTQESPESQVPSAAPDGASDEEILAAAKAKAAEVLEAVRDDPGAPFAPEALEALAELKERDPAEWQRVRAGLKKAKVPLRDLDRCLAKAKMAREGEAAQARGYGPRYEVVDGRICYMKTAFTEEGVVEVPVPLSNFDACIVAEVVRDDGAQLTRSYILKGQTDDGRPLAEVEVPAAEYGGMRWVAEKWGTAALVYAGQAVKDHLRVAIQELSCRVPVRTVFAHTGWRKVSGKWIYLHGAGAVGPTGTVAGVDVCLEGRLRDLVLIMPPDLPTLRRAVRASLRLLDLAPDVVTVPLLGATYFAPLGQATPLDFSLWLEGQSGVFKSEVTALAQSHWGPKWSGRYLPGNWSSTVNRLERDSFLAKDAVFTIDDLCPTGSKRDVQEKHREVDRLLRSQGNRGGRARLSADGRGREEYYPRGLIVTSAETMPRGLSLNARTWVARVAPKDVDVRRLSEAQRLAKRGVFAVAMCGYVGWLARQMDRLIDELPLRRSDLRAKAGKTGHGRTADTVAALALGFGTFLQFARAIDAITHDEAVALCRRAWDALRRGAAQQAQNRESEEPAAIFLRLLAAAFLAGRAHLADLKKDGRPGKDPALWGWRELEPKGERVGWVDGDKVYLNTEAAYAVVQKLASDQGESALPPQKTLFKRLSEKGLLAKEDKDHHGIKETIPAIGKRLRLLCLYAKAIFPEGGADEPSEGPNVEDVPLDILGFANAEVEEGVV